MPSFLLFCLLLCCVFTIVSAFPNPFKKIKEKFNDIKNEIKNEFISAVQNNANNEIENTGSSILLDDLYLHDKPVGEVVSTIQQDIAYGDGTNNEDQSSIDNAVINEVQIDNIDAEQAAESDSMHDDISNNEDISSIDHAVINEVQIDNIDAEQAAEGDSIHDDISNNEDISSIDHAVINEVQIDNVDAEQAAEGDSIHDDISNNEDKSSIDHAVINEVQIDNVDAEQAAEGDSIHDDISNNEMVMRISNTDAVSIIIDSSTIDIESIINHFAVNESAQELDALDSDNHLEYSQQIIDDEVNRQESEEETLRQEAEEERLRQEAEEERLRQEAEEERLRQEAEEERLRQEAEEERLRQEAEEERLRQEAEIARLKQEAEEERLRQEAYHGNWSSFSVLSFVDPDLSINIIKSLKFSSYFDKSIGEFKVGILGVDMSSVLPSDLIINVEKSMNRKFINVSSVDVTSLLSHSLVGIKHIATTMIPLHIHPQLDTFSEKPEVMHQVESKFAALHSNPNSSLSKELRVSRGIIENKLHKMETFIIKQHEVTKHKMALEAYKLQRNLELLQKQHEQLIELIDKSSKNISNSITANHKQRYEVLLLSNKHVLNESIQVFKVQLDMEKAMLKHRNDISIELLKYQALQEQQYVIDNELNNNFLLEIMNNNTRDSTQMVIETIFNDVTQMLRETIIENPTGFVFNNLHVIAIVFGIIILVEIVGFIPMYLLHRKNSNILLKSNQMRKVKNQSQLSELVLTTTMAADLKTYMENVEIGLQYKCTAIPNLLIIGSSGTGKSVLAHAIAEKLQASYVSICEADLEPLGMNASYYLRNLFQSKYGASLWEQKKKPFLIIIDGADLLIKPRKPKFISKSSKCVSPRGTPHAYEGSKGSAIDDQVCSNCLYTLLNEMKVASPHVSLIITTNRSVGDIDSAILNRTDSIVVLTKPSQLQRLRYILYNLPINVGQFLDDESIKILSDASLVQYLRSMNTSKSNEITNQLVRSIVNNIKKQSSNDPETDRPASLNLKVVTAPVATTNSFDSYSNTTFDLEICISKFVVMTDGWSFRELEKFLLSLRQEILSISYVGQDSKLVLTSMVFMKTLELVGNSNNSDK